MTDCPTCGWPYTSEYAATECEERDRREDAEARRYFKTAKE